MYIVNTVGRHSTFEKVAICTDSGVFPIAICFL